MNPPYKSPSNSWLSRALFWEEWIQMTHEMRKDNLKPPFTLYHDRPGYISGRKTFVEFNDPTGYKWAMKYLGDYAHWKALLKCKWFVEALDVWIDELETKIRSEALDKIKEIQDEGQPAQSLVAAKYLAGFEWKAKGTRGRPSKQEVAGELKRATAILETEKTDAQRIGLTLKVVK